jgi:hypothetical protein
VKRLQELAVELSDSRIPILREQLQDDGDELAAGWSRVLDECQAITAELRDAAIAAEAQTGSTQPVNQE